jgi:hypothetical protein
LNTTTPSPALPSAALALHRSCQQRLRHQCASLRNLVRHLVDSGADDARVRGALAELGPAFEATLALHRADQETDLFPALLESMAGSDATCIRQMAQDLGAEHRALDTQWRRVRAALEAIVDGAKVEMPSTEVEALASLCERHTDFEDAELLPMADRLLSDPELARLVNAMAERRERL